jgi:1,4-dihydroxy-6-naphthoate synthase
MKLTLGFSPCPNDTFIFDALVNGKVDTGGLSFDVLLEDVQTLNEWALAGKLDITKVSYGVLPLILKDYRVLKTGGALGMGVGPLLIGPSPLPFQQASPSPLQGERGAHNLNIDSLIEKSIVAIPGENTTAHFLFSQAFPQAKNKVFLRFDEIEDWVISGRGMGVIIHENRFTYQQKRLYKWADLGQIWEEKTGLPIPLGGIVVKKGFPADKIEALTFAIQQSLAYAQNHYPELSEYIRCHAQEMDVQVMRQHIDLYVNDFSHDIQENGKKSILHMAAVLGGKNPRKQNLSVGSPAILNAAITAEHPGIVKTVIPSGAQAATNLYPGSAISGVPASLIKATRAPCCNFSSNIGRLLAALWSW